MNDIINNIMKEVKDAIDEYKEESEDNYDFWEQHIKYVYDEAINLASIYKADLEIVKIGALLHDIALIKKYGDRKEHHTNGVILAKEILNKYEIDEMKKERILGCIKNHRSSKNATNIEEMCVADSDIIAHFDNIPMLFNSAFNRNKINLNDVRNWMKKCFEDDYNDLSNQTKEIFKERYEEIIKIVLS